MHAEMPRLAGQKMYGIANPLALSISDGPAPSTKFVHHALVGRAREPDASSAPSAATQRSGLGACCSPRVITVTPSLAGSTRE
jgi:hypothetical protein